MSTVINKLGHLLLTFFLCSIVVADISKSPEDDKEYRYLELDNAMKVLLVSDPSADKSGAALDVHVGNGSDPDDWAGLAHFLEHMLFLGTRKYPEPGEYQSFISAHGGSNNAYTSFDHTNYYFSIASDYLEPALDRFSQFFVAPLLESTHVDRERSIIQSEYQSLKKNEFRRLWDTEKTWLNPEHPSSRFSVGSLETLADREGMTARDKLAQFHETYYSANLMTLAVVGREPLDQLQEWVTDKFSAVKNRGTELPRHEQPYFNRDLIPARIDAIPEKEYYGLSFTFPIPSTYDEYESKPLSYISHLLGHEGPGSLLEVLKQRGWAESLKAGPGFVDRVQGSFTVSIDLTREGLGQIDSIGDLLFQTVNLIRKEGIERWRFDEQARLGQIAFRYAQEPGPGRLAQSLASRLHRYPPDDALRGPFVMERYDPGRVRELLGYLIPDNVNIRIVAPGLETDRVSAHYDVDYSLSRIGPDTIRRWKQVSGTSDLALPGRNLFIPGRLELLGTVEETRIPQSVDNHYGIELWHQYDSEFGDPRANLYVNLMSPVTYRSPADRIMTEMYVRFVIDQLSDIVYDAYLAGLNYELFSHYRGITLKISGFEEPQGELLRSVLEALAAPQFEPRRLEIIRHSVERELKNIFLEPPANQAIHEIYRILMVPYWTEEERLEALQQVDVAELEDFISRFYQDMRVVMLSHGDVGLEASLERAEMVAELLPSNEPGTPVPRIDLRKLDEGAPWLRTIEIDHSDATLSAYFQGRDNSREERTHMALLVQILRPRFYNRIRTVNEVGYLVFSGSLDIERWPGLFLAAQSSTHSPDEILDLYEEFLLETTGYLEEMSGQEFDRIRKGLITRILRKPQKLADRTSVRWQEIDLEEYGFDTRKKLADRVEGLTLDDIRSFYRSRVLENPARLLVQSTGTALEGSISEGFVPVGSASSLERVIR